MVAIANGQIAKVKPVEVFIAHKCHFFSRCAPETSAHIGTICYSCFGGFAMDDVRYAADRARWVDALALSVMMN